MILKIVMAIPKYKQIEKNVNIWMRYVIFVRSHPGKLTGNTFLYSVRDRSGSGVRAWKARISNVSTVLPDRAAGWGGQEKTANAKTKRKDWTEKGSSINDVKVLKVFETTILRSNYNLQRVDEDSTDN